MGNRRTSKKQWTIEKLVNEIHEFDSILVEYNGLSADDRKNLTKLKNRVLKHMVYSKNPEYVSKIKPFVDMMINHWKQINKKSKKLPKEELDRKKIKTLESRLEDIQFSSTIPFINLLRTINGIANEFRTIRGFNEEKQEMKVGLEDKLSLYASESMTIHSASLLANLKSGLKPYFSVMREFRLINQQLSSLGVNFSCDSVPYRVLSFENQFFIEGLGRFKKPKLTLKYIASLDDLYSSIKQKRLLPNFNRSMVSKISNRIFEEFIDLFKKSFKHVPKSINSIDQLISAISPNLISVEKAAIGFFKSYGAYDILEEVFDTRTYLSKTLPKLLKKFESAKDSSYFLPYGLMILKTVERYPFLKCQYTESIKQKVVSYVENNFQQFVDSFTLLAQNSGEEDIISSINQPIVAAANDLGLEVHSGYNQLLLSANRLITELSTKSNHADMRKIKKLRNELRNNVELVDSLKIKNALISLRKMKKPDLRKALKTPSITAGFVNLNINYYEGLVSGSEGPDYLNDSRLYFISVGEMSDVGYNATFIPVDKTDSSASPIFGSIEDISILKHSYSVVLTRTVLTDDGAKSDRSYHHFEEDSLLFDFIRFTGGVRSIKFSGPLLHIEDLLSELFNADPSLKNINVKITPFVPRVDRSFSLVYCKKYGY